MCKKIMEGLKLSEKWLADVDGSSLLAGCLGLVGTPLYVPGPILQLELKNGHPVHAHNLMKNWSGYIYIYM